MTRVLSVSGSVRHGEMLALKSASFWGKNDLLVIQNSTDKTHIQSGHTSPARASAARPSAVPKFHGDCDFPARVPSFHAPNSLRTERPPLRAQGRKAKRAGETQDRRQRGGRECRMGVASPRILAGHGVPCPYEEEPRAQMRAANGRSRGANPKGRRRRARISRRTSG